MAAVVAAAAAAIGGGGGVSFVLSPIHTSPDMEGRLSQTRAGAAAPETFSPLPSALALSLSHWLGASRSLSSCVRRRKGRREKRESSPLLRSPLFLFPLPFSQTPPAQTPTANRNTHVVPPTFRFYPVLFLCGKLRAERRACT